MTDEELGTLLAEFKLALNRLCEREDRLIEELANMRVLLDNCLHSGETDEQAELNGLCQDITHLLERDFHENQSAVEQQIAGAQFLMDLLEAKDEPKIFS